MNPPFIEKILIPQKLLLENPNWNSLFWDFIPAFDISLETIPNLPARHHHPIFLGGTNLFETQT